jgi:hypothetical protein
MDNRQIESMDITILVSIRNVYGEDKYDPESPQAERLAQLVGTKTLTPRTLAMAKEMGFKIGVKPSDLPMGLA